MAYVLNTDPEFKVSMGKIGDILNVSQSTVSTAIKEVKYQKEIYDLTKELNKAKDKVLELEFNNEPKLISPISFSEAE
ncbi:hypothetical protein FDA52_17715 [Clostridium botulinum]|nr:hypothetical protein [Clostridium botulinum]NFI54738.1 hypothetical protein [Clostridium botulinum]